jgi:hydrogenase expression/formation protein HypC
MCLAIPGKLMNRSEIAGVSFGQVEFAGIKREVCLDFVPEAGIGDYVLVHVGFAISRLDEQEAHRTYEILEQMGLLQEEISAMRNTDGVAEA